MSSRTADSPPIYSVFLDRWSHRSSSDEPVTNEQLEAIFEAARWSPSWMNNQPWIFAYDTDGAGREPILNTFMEFNRGWVSAAPVVGLVLAKTELEGFIGRTRNFDTGAALMSLTLQATMLGLSVHLLGVSKSTWPTRSPAPAATPPRCCAGLCSYTVATPRHCPRACKQRKSQATVSR
jgi:nitroreductase